MTRYSLLIGRTGFASTPNLVNRPSRVLRDQWLWVGCGAFERRNVGRVACVAQGDTHIAQKPATLDSFNRRTFEKRAELCVSQFQIFPQRHAGRRLARGKSCFLRNLSEPVPGTDYQTIIATEDPISDKRAKLQRNGTLQFNRQIRDAAAGIESMRRCNRTGRARCDAALTCSAAIGGWLIRWQFERGQNLREKKPCPDLFID